MPENLHFELTAHAVTVMAERQIPLVWVECVLMKPERIEPDRMDPDLRHALGRIPERDDRILRVVYNKNTEPWRVVTAYFDRSMRDKL
jgi:hypothetical protein